MRLSRRSFLKDVYRENTNLTSQKFLAGAHNHPILYSTIGTTSTTNKAFIWYTWRLGTRPLRSPRIHKQKRPKPEPSRRRKIYLYQPAAPPVSVCLPKKQVLCVFLVPERLQFFFHSQNSITLLVFFLSFCTLKKLFSSCISVLVPVEWRSVQLSYFIRVSFRFCIFGSVENNNNFCCCCWFRCV